MTLKKIIPLTFLLILVACSESDQQAGAAAGQQMPPTAVTLVKPEAGEMQELITVPGSLVSYQSATISTEIAGIIKEFHVEDGGTVKKDTLLFSIDSATLRAEMQRAEATVNLRLEEKKRAQSLFKRNVGSQHEVDEANTQLLTAEADRDYARARLQKASIKAPFSGTLGIRKVNAGNYVKAGTGLIDLVQLDPLFLDFSVPETAVSVVAVGMVIDVEIAAFANMVVKARIVAMEPAFNTTTRSLGVRAQLDNREGKFLSGSFVRIHLPVKKESKVLWLPESAIFYEGSKRLVMVSDQGKSLRKEVEVVSFQNGRAAIVAGLSEQDQVVSAGHHKAPFDGMPLIDVAAIGQTSPMEEITSEPEPSAADDQTDVNQ